MDQEIPENDERLSLREERFCLAVANTGDKYKAFEIAGYEARTKGARAACVSRLLKRPRIKKRIDELQREYCLAMGITSERILANLAEIAFDKENNKSDRNRALELLGKSQAMFTDKQVTEDISPLAAERQAEAKTRALEAAQTERLRLVRVEGETA